MRKVSGQKYCETMSIRIRVAPSRSGTHLLIEPHCPPNIVHVADDYAHHLGRDIVRLVICWRTELRPVPEYLLRNQPHPLLPPARRYLAHDKRAFVHAFGSFVSLPNRNGRKAE